MTDCIFPQLERFVCVRFFLSGIRKVNRLIKVPGKIRSYCLYIFGSCASTVKAIDNIGRKNLTETVIGIKIRVNILRTLLFYNYREYFEWVYSSNQVTALHLPYLHIPV